MKINTLNPNYKSPNFKSWMNNKTVLKGLETISEHGTTFIAATTLLMASGVRPLAIALTPKVDKENKQYASTNSIASGFIKFALVEAIALPVENAIKKIDKNPEKFLNSQTINNLKDSAPNLIDSRIYKFATQTLKLSTGFITAIPKAMLTIALIPLLMDKLFNKKAEKIPEKFSDNTLANERNPKLDSKSLPSFKGNLTACGIGKIIDNKFFQNFIKNHYQNDTNIARNMSIATDLLLTASFIHRTRKSEKIKENRKKPLIYNNAISTAISIIAGYSIDNLIKKNTQNFIKKFSDINKNDPKLPKYIEGINIIRPTLIFAAIYYGILPIFSTYLADKIDKLTHNKASKNE